MLGYLVIVVYDVMYISTTKHRDMTLIVLVRYDTGCVAKAHVIFDILN